MQADEYDLFMKDQFDFGLRKFTPRTWGAFEPLANIPSLSSYQGLPQRLMAMCQDPAFQKLFKAIWKASQEKAKFQKVAVECARISLEMGYPPLMGGMALAPFDTVADMLRGTHGSVMDMYRQPEKLLEALEVIAERSLESAVSMANMARSPIIFIPMHKGDDSFMSVKQFEKFYWPTFRKLLLGFINEGCVPMMVIDGSYNERPPENYQRTAPDLGRLDDGKDGHVQSQGDPGQFRLYRRQRYRGAALYADSAGD